MDMEIDVGLWDEASGADFAAREWGTYNEEHGVDWSPSALRLVARVGGTPAGMAAFVLNGGLAELRELLVARPFAGQGVGSRLIAEFEDHARRARCHKTRLETADYQARPFYERHGYHVEAVLERDRFERTWYVMSKTLGAAG